MYYEKMSTFAFNNVILISNVYLWNWLTVENGDLINLSIWNSLVNLVQTKIWADDIIAGTNLTVTQSWWQVLIDSINWSSESITPFIVSTQEFILAPSSTVDIVIQWEYLLPTTSVTIPWFNWVINSITTNSPNELKVSITTDNSSWDYNVILSNWSNSSDTWWINNWINLLKVSTLTSSCLAILNSGASIWNGNYDIQIWWSIINVYCDMTTDWGGWTRVYYSNSNIVDLSSIDRSDWNLWNTINYSLLWSTKDLVNNNLLQEYYIVDNNWVDHWFTQTNSYINDPIWNNYTKTFGSYIYNTTTNTWYWLGLGSYWNSSMAWNCTLSSQYNWNSWWGCIQDFSSWYGTWPWNNRWTSSSIQIFKRW